MRQFAQFRGCLSPPWPCLFVLHSALAPNTGEYKCAFSFIIAQMIFLSKPPSLLELELGLIISPKAGSFGADGTAGSGRRVARRKAHEGFCLV